MEKLPKFTEEEQIFIDHCFNSTLHIFVENPLNRDNIEDIRKAVNYRNYNIGSIGVKNHEYMHSIFDKIGYCNDGKTTKSEAHKREIALEEEKAAIWTTQRDSAILKCDERIAELQQIKRDLISHDKMFNKIAEEKAVVAKEEFQEKIKEERTESRNMLIRETNDQISGMNTRELRKLASERGVKCYSRMNKAEMQIAIKETY